MLFKLLFSRQPPINPQPSSSSGGVKQSPASLVCPCKQHSTVQPLPLLGAQLQMLTWLISVSFSCCRNLSQNKNSRGESNGKLQSHSFFSLCLEEPLQYTAGAMHGLGESKSQPEQAGGKSHLANPIWQPARQGDASPCHARLPTLHVHHSPICQH